MEYNFDDLNLTKNQILKLHTLHDGNVLSFEAFEGKIKVQTLMPLSYTEMNILKDAIQTLPDTPIEPEQDYLLFQTSDFKGKTPEEMKNWIKANVTDFVSSKLALEKMAEVIVMLVRRSDLNK